MTVHRLSKGDSWKRPPCNNKPKAQASESKQSGPCLAASTLLAALRVLEHIAAGFFALAAFLGALLHHRVVLEFLAGVAAAFAGVDARDANQVAEGPALGDDRRSRAANL